MLVLGGSVYAVKTAVNLSKRGFEVKLVNDRKRVGVFPQALLPEEFFKIAGVEPEHFSEAVFDEATINQKTVRLPTTIYLVRTTPLLEKSLAVNGVALTKEQVKETAEVVDCRPQPWRHFRLIQMLSVNRQRRTNTLQITLHNDQSVKITANGGNTSLTYFYFRTEYEPAPDLIALSELYFCYNAPKPRPLVGWLGQDVAEAAAGEALETMLNTAAPVNIESYLTGMT